MKYLNTVAFLRSSGVSLSNTIREPEFVSTVGLVSQKLCQFCHKNSFLCVCLNFSSSNDCFKTVSFLFCQTVMYHLSQNPDIFVNSLLNIIFPSVLPAWAH